jgi:hypothetical protein
MSTSQHQPHVSPFLDGILLFWGMGTSKDFFLSKKMSTSQHDNDNALKERETTS